ncbi:hypothetical protein LCGC14_2858760 [marine sediment metagenome]|uniref:HNH nuclease domain-containing protein n=1 Tax=marine sediment metagenome TaxID=412755 RepID=A0A0F8YT40_9ZZZZ
MTDNDERKCSIIGCNNKHFGNGWCEKHYKRHYRTKSTILKTSEERFNEKWIPVTETGCWLWMAHKNPNGYGTLRVDSVDFPAHRYSWMLHKGRIPEGLCVLHKCDTPLCVNPEHLWLGTKKDNTHDAIKKGRMHWQKGI